MNYVRTVIGIAGISMICSCSSTPASDTITRQSEPNQDSVIVTYNNCTVTAEDCSYFAAYFPVFAKEDVALNKFVNKRKKIMGGYFAGDTESLQQAGETFILSFDTFATSFPESARSWYTRMELTVDSSFNGIVQFSEYYEDYTGGAHDNYNSNYFLVNNQTGTSLVLKDVVHSSALIELTARITQAYRQQEGVDTNVPLSEHGLFSDQISPVDNFFISKESIGFLYNPYEIAPYSTGVIEVRLPLEEVQHLFKEEFKAYLVKGRALS